MKDTNILLKNGVNLEKSLELFGDIETYNNNLDVFLKGISNKLDILRNLKEIADMKNYASNVSSLKMDARYFGFGSLAQLAFNHEIESKANNIYYIYEHYEELVNEVNKMIEIASEYLEIDVSKITEVVEKVNKQILVVDDSNIIRSFVKRISNKYEVLAAVDGEEAIKIIEENDDIDGMLLDLNMPNVDGFSVLDYFKVKNLFLKTPVVIITGEDDEKLIDKTYEYPIVAILRKPCNEKNVKEAIENIMKNKIS